MKTTLRSLVFLFVTILLLPLRGAEAIEGVTIHSVSSAFGSAGWDLNANHLVDGSGLSGDPLVHAQNNFSNQNSWQTDTTSATANVQFDLGDVYKLDHLALWNLNFYAPYNGRGARKVDIYTSTDASSWLLAASALEFPMASGLDQDPGFTIEAGDWEQARYVQFAIGSNWGGSDSAGHVGLSEVVFFAVPEPAAFGLIGLAILVFSLRCRPGERGSCRPHRPAMSAS